MIKRMFFACVVAIAVMQLTACMVADTATVRRGPANERVVMDSVKAARKAQAAELKARREAERRQQKAEAKAQKQKAEIKKSKAASRNQQTDGTTGASPRSWR